MDLSIIILNYKTKGLALNCIKSIKEADLAGFEYEIIVVDNNSQDNLGEILAWQYPDITFVQNGKNLGMGAGNNVGIARARGEYVVIMNPDTIASADVFKQLHQFMERNSQIGMVGPKQYNPDQTVQESCYRWHKLATPFYRRTPLGKMKAGKKDLHRFLMKDFDKAVVKDVDWLLGSFLFIRYSALQKVGNFDERFFLYFEDTDWCRRFWQKKYRVVYYPEARIIHNHCRASVTTSWYRLLVNHTSRTHIISWLKYLYKWRSDN